MAICILVVGLSPALPAVASATSPAIPVWIDTDTGVDDAVAVAALLRSPQVNIRGISAVAGNTTVENASNNILTLLDVAQRTDIPVIYGADAPLSYPLSRLGIFIHGADGFQGALRPHNLAALPRDPATAICAAARANPNLTLLALGPLTNVALAARSCQADLARIKIITLNGARELGNRTPVAATNTFIDPHALAEVLHSGLQVTLVTQEAVRAITFDSSKVIPMLSRSRDPLAQLLAQPLGRYVAAQSGGQTTTFTLPDLVPVLYLLNPTLAAPKPALVYVHIDNDPWRGSTIIGITPNEMVLMIGTDTELSELAVRLMMGEVMNLNAEVGAILMRQPANTQVVLSVEQKRNTTATLRAFFSQGGNGNNSSNGDDDE
jgi:inosine-uridine nucleoside N-ribohydrolase